MPMTLPGQAKLNALSGISNRTDLVTVYLPMAAFGVEHAAEVEINIRPTLDESCPGNIDGIVADAWIEPLVGEALKASDPDAILLRIKAEQPLTWEEIELKAVENFREGCAYDASGSTYYAEVA